MKSGEQQKQMFYVLMQKIIVWESKAIQWLYGK